MTIPVKEKWDQLAVKYLKKAVTERLYTEIEKCYSSADRHYHNLNHIYALLHMSDQFQHRLADKDVVDFAIFYHDIFYNALRKDNEEKSAGLAYTRLEELRIPQVKRESVKIFIEATKKHQLEEVDNKNDLALFLDFDMAILAADWNEYVEYTRQIRKEYHLYPDMLYNPGRKKFLINCLNSKFIFHTSEFQNTCETQARQNMERELQSL